MNKKYIVIFRASANFPNNELENLLKKTKYNIVTFPILKVENTCSKPINTTKAQAVLVTSSNGLYNLSKLSNDRLIKIFTVGSVSKNLAKKFGYKNIIDCDGDSGKMYNVVLNNTTKDSGELLYVGADNISADLPKMFKEVGYKVKRYVVYKTKELEMIDSKFTSLIKSKKVGWIILLSKKGAANFNRLINKNFNLDSFKNVKFACLSSNVASELSNHIPYKFYPRKPSLNDLKCVILKYG